MKKYRYVLILLPVAVIIVVLGIYFLRENGDPISSKQRGEDQRPDRFSPVDSKSNEETLSRLFEEMGVVQLDPVEVPAEIKLPDLNGRYVSLSDFKGKILFINFWATWCPPCREEMPSMQKLHDRLKDKDFVMVAIDLQEPVEPVKKFLEEYKLTFMSLLDANGEVGFLFGIQSIPTTLIIDKQGRVIGAAIGARDWAGKKSIALFEHLINQEVEILS